MSRNHLLIGHRTTLHFHLLNHEIVSRFLGHLLVFVPFHRGLILADLAKVRFTPNHIAESFVLAGMVLDTGR